VGYVFDTFAAQNIVVRILEENKEIQNANILELLVYVRSLTHIFIDALFTKKFLVPYLVNIPVNTFLTFVYQLKCIIKTPFLIVFKKFQKKNTKNSKKYEKNQKITSG